IDLEPRAENGDAVGADIHYERTSVVDDIEHGAPLQQADVPVPPTEACLQAGLDVHVNLRSIRKTDLAAVVARDVQLRRRSLQAEHNRGGNSHYYDRRRGR